MIKVWLRWLLGILGSLGVLGGSILSCAAISNKVVAITKHHMKNDDPELPIKKYTPDTNLQTQFLNKINNYQPKSKVLVKNAKINKYRNATDNLQLAGPLNNEIAKSKDWGANVLDLKFDFILIVNGSEKTQITWNKKIEKYVSPTWVDIKLNFHTYHLQKNDQLAIKLKNVYAVDSRADWKRAIGLSLEPVSVSESQAILGNSIQNVSSYDLESVTLHLQYETKNWTHVVGRTISRYIWLWIDTINKATFNIQTHYTADESYQKNIFVNKIYMTSYELAHQSLTSNNLKQILQLYESQNLIRNVNWISEPYLDKNQGLILGKLKYYKSNFSYLREYSEPIELKIPISILNFNYFFKASLASSTKFYYGSDNSKKYWATKPRTVICINDNFIRTLYIWIAKPKLLALVPQLILDVEKQKILSNKINVGAINEANFNYVKALIKTNKFDVIKKLIAPSYYIKISHANNWSSRTIFQDYLQVLKGVSLSFQTGFIEKISWKLNQIGNKAYQINQKNVDDSLRGQINWNIILHHFQLVNLDNHIFLNDTRGYKIAIPDKTIQKNYCVDLAVTNDERELKHNYYFQAKTLDISRDVSFVMSDGTILDQDYKIISSQHQELIGQFAYKQIRWKYRTASFQTYLLVHKNNAGEWYSNKMQKTLKELDPNFKEEDIQYVFDKELNLIINPYANMISSHLDPTLAKKLGIKIMPNAWKYYGIHTGTLPQLPVGISASPLAFLIDGQTRDLLWKPPQGINSNPDKYLLRGTLTKVEYDSLPRSLKNLIAKYSWNISGTTTSEYPRAPVIKNVTATHGVASQTTAIANNLINESGNESGISWLRQAIGHMSLSERYLSVGTKSYKKQAVESDTRMDLDWNINGLWYNSYYTDYTTSQNQYKESGTVVSNLTWNKNWHSLTFNFETIGGKPDQNPINGYRSSPTFSLRKKDANTMEILANGSVAKTFNINQSLSNQKVKIGEEYHNDFGIVLSWNADGQITIKLYVQTNNTDSWTYIMVLRNIVFQTEDMSHIWTYHGIFQGENLPALPDGIMATEIPYQVNQEISLDEYNALPQNLKNKCNVVERSIHGILYRTSVPPLPTGVNSSVWQWYVSGVYKSKIKPPPISGITITPNSYEIQYEAKDKPISILELAGKPRYAIKKVMDNHKGQQTILESWVDGKWSHTTKDDKPIFDGVFGADMNGLQDGRGLLNQGEHKIKIELFKNNVLKKNKFNICIDFSPVDVEVSSSGRLIKSQILEKGKYYDFYYATEPINFYIKDQDIAEALAFILDSNGTCYQLPIQVNSLLKDNVYYQYIDSTINYVGFAKVKIVDRAGNIKIVFFKLDKKGSPNPKTLYKLSDVQSKIIYQNQELMILQNRASFLLTDPLAFNINLTKIVRDKKGELIEQNASNKIHNYNFTIPTDYRYGKTIDASGKKPLDYAADELKPFLSDIPKAGIWKTQNKEININEDGLYRLDYDSKLISKPNDTIYLYLNENQQINIPDLGNIFTSGTSQNFHLPNSKKISKLTNTFINPKLLKQIMSYVKSQKIDVSASIKIDYAMVHSKTFEKNTEIQKYLGATISQQGKITKDFTLMNDRSIEQIKAFDINNFSFEIKSLKTYYSLLWCSEFAQENDPLNFSREGKYHLVAIDMFNKVHVKDFLIINKTKTVAQRKSENDIQIYADENNSHTAFWKGQVIWWYYRYEDADHAIWEKSHFIQDAMKKGLSRQEAELAYGHLKADPTWAGDIKHVPGGFKLKDLAHKSIGDLMKAKHLEKVEVKIAPLAKGDKKASATRTKSVESKKIVYKPIKVASQESQAKAHVQKTDTSVQATKGPSGQKQGSEIKATTETKHTHDSQIQAAKHHAKNKKQGFVMGAIVLGSILAIGIGWLLIRRIKNRKIK